MRPPRRTRRTALFAAVVFPLLLVITACGSDDGATSDDDGSGGTAANTEGDEAALNGMLPERIRDAGKIIVSSPLQNPPYAFLEANGETLNGIAPDLSKALEPLLGVEFEWVDTPFPSLIAGLEAGQFDMIWGNITDTVEREEVLDFVDYHMDGALLLVETGNPGQIDSIESTCGHTIGALSGSIQIEMLEEQKTACEDEGEPTVDIKIYPDVPGGLTAVRSGQATAFFAGVGAARYQAEVAPDQFDTAGPIYQASPFGAGFRKDDQQLTKAIQTGLKQLVEDGAYLEVLDRYGMGLTALKGDQILINGAEQLGKEILDVEQE